MDGGVLLIPLASWVQGLATMAWAYGQLSHFDDELFEVLAVRCVALLPSHPRAVPINMPMPAIPSGASLEKSPMAITKSFVVEPGSQEKGARVTGTRNAAPRAEAPRPPSSHYSSWSPQTFSMVAMAYARNNCVQSTACQSLLAAIADEARLHVDAFNCQVSPD